MVWSSRRRAAWFGRLSAVSVRSRARFTVRSPGAGAGWVSRLLAKGVRALGLRVPTPTVGMVRAHSARGPRGRLGPGDQRCRRLSWSWAVLLMARRRDLEAPIRFVDPGG